MSISKKGLARISMVLAAVLLLFSACAKEEKEYNEELLYGTWNASGSMQYYFDQDHTGWRGDDEGSKNFDWTLSADELTLKFRNSGSTSMVVTKVYIIDNLTETALNMHEREYASNTISLKK